MDLSTLNTLGKIYESIGHALNQEQQLFVSKEYVNLHHYLNSDAGKKALQVFIDTWSKKDVKQSTEPLFDLRLK